MPGIQIRSVKPLRLIIYGVLLGGVVFIAWVAWILFGPVDEQDPQLESLEASPGARVYRVQDEGSRMDFTLAVLNRTIDSEIGINGEEFQLIPEDDGYRVRANLIIDAQSVETGNDQYNQLLSVAFKSREYPTGKYVASSTTIIPGTDGEYTFTLNGSLELGGVVVEDFPVEVVMNISETSLSATSTASMDMRMFVEGDEIPFFVDDPIMPVQMFVEAEFDRIVPLAREFQIVPEVSRLRFTMQTIRGEVTGTFDIIGESVVFSPEEGGWRLSATLLIDGESADTGNATMDLMVVTLFEGRVYTGKFVGKADSLIPEVSGIHEVVLTGKLELKGQIEEFSIPVRFEVQATEFRTLEARSPVDVEPFGVTTGLQSTVLDVRIEVDASELALTEANP